MCSHKSDIWSIACVVYELLAPRKQDGSSRPPFEAPELAYKVLTANPAPLPSACSAPLRQVVTEMLEKEPRERPGSTELLRSPCVAGYVKRWLACGLSAR